MNDKVKWYLSLLFSKRSFFINVFNRLNLAPKVSIDKYILFSRLKEQSIAELLEFHDTYCIKWNHMFSAEDVENRLRQGHRCYLAHIHKQLVGFIWIAVNSVYSPDLFCTFEFESHCSVYYNGYVRSDYRGKNILPSIMWTAFQELSSEGYKKYFSYNGVNNNSIIKTNKKFDASVVGTISCGYFLGYYFFSPSINIDAPVKSQLADLQEKPVENVDSENILPSVLKCVRNCSFT